MEFLQRRRNCGSVRLRRSSKIFCVPWKFKAVTRKVFVLWKKPSHLNGGCCTSMPNMNRKRLPSTSDGRCMAWRSAWRITWSRASKLERSWIKSFCLILFFYCVCYVCMYTLLYSYVWYSIFIHVDPCSQVKYWMMLFNDDIVNDVWHDEPWKPNSRLVARNSSSSSQS